MAKTVFVSHPIAGQVEENVKDILRICREIHTQDVIPVAPYLVAVQYLNDHVGEERELGIAANVEHFKRKVMDEMWLCGPKISAGMEEEIRLCLKFGIPVRCYNPELRPELERIMELIKKERKII